MHLSTRGSGTTPKSAAFDWGTRCLDESWNRGYEIVGYWTELGDILSRIQPLGMHRKQNLIVEKCCLHAVCSQC